MAGVDIGIIFAPFVKMAPILSHHHIWVYPLYSQRTKFSIIDYPDIPSNFARLDLDSDGYISKSELMELMDQWYSSTDPADPGNYLAGPL